MITRQLLEVYRKEKTPLFINGMGIGKITKIEEDYIDFKVIKKGEKSTGKGKDKKTEKVLTKEITHIQISNIATISTGEKEIPKTEQEKEIDDDLGDI